MPLFKSETDTVFEAAYSTMYDRFEAFCRQDPFPIAEAPSVCGALMEASLLGGHQAALASVQAPALQPLWTKASDKSAMQLIEAFAAPVLAYLSWLVQRDNQNVLTDQVKNKVADALLAVLGDEAPESRTHFAWLDTQFADFATEGRGYKMLPNIVLVDAVAALENRYPVTAWHDSWSTSVIPNWADFIMCLALADEDLDVLYDLRNTIHIQIACLSPAYQYAARSLQEFLRP
ncbi:MAG: hypothetical protein WEB04_11040 [Dehalococcoidia bacterium]